MNEILLLTVYIMNTFYKFSLILDTFFIIFLWESLTIWLDPIRLVGTLYLYLLNYQTKVMCIFLKKIVAIHEFDYYEYENTRVMDKKYTIKINLNHSKVKLMHSTQL